MDMSLSLVLGLVAGGVLLIALMLGLLAWLALSSQRRASEQRERQDELRQMLVALRSENDDLRRQVEELQQRPSTPESHLITDAGSPAPADGDATPVSDRLVVGATLGEPLIRAASALHGLRRALSPEERNRIRFEMRRELKRARKERRRQSRALMRERGERTIVVPGRDIA